MHTRKQSWFLAVVILLTTLLSQILLSLSGLGLWANLTLKEQLTPKESGSLANFAIVSLAATPDEDLVDTVKWIAAHSNKRLFWVLPDKPIPAPVKSLLTEHRIHSIKVPDMHFSRNGKLQYHERSRWQPSAGYLVTPEAHFGKVRTLWWQTQTDLQVFLSPLAALSPQVDAAIAETRFIDFSQVSLNSPIITSALMAEPDVIKQMITNKDVYLLAEMRLQDASVQIPHHPGGLGWHALQYYAAALLAWETSQTFLEPSLPVKLAIVFLFTGLLTAIFYMSPPATKQIRVLATGLLLILASMPLASLAQFIPPVSELLLALILMMSGLQWVINRNSDRSIVALEEQLKSISETPAAKQESPTEFWHNIATMVSQSLQLERCIFLEISDNAHRLREISAINCSLKDIDEMRRDIRREPYLHATQNKQAVKSTRPYFKDRQQDESEILVPFYKGTHVLGFWALTTFEQDKEKLAQLFEQINLFAMQISTLLHLQQQASLGGELQKRLHQQLGNEQNQRLRTIQSGARQLLTQLNFQHSLQDATSSPQIVFDIFGRPAHLNYAMQTLVQRNQINVSDTSALTFLKTLLPLSEDSIKNLIRQITLQQKQQSKRYFITIEDSKYIAVISSTNFSGTEQSQQELHLSLNGIVVELQSLKDVQAHLQIERGLYDNFLIHIKNHLSTLQMGLLQIERKAEMPFINQLATYLNIELKKAAEITRRTHFFMNRLSVSEDVNSIPFRPLDIVNSEVNSKQKNTGHNGLWRDVRFNLNLPSYAILGLGSPDAFSHVIKSSLKLLADDAIAPKQINILGKHLVRNNTDVLYLKIESDGYGLPDEQLQKLYQQNAVLGEQTLLSDLVVASKSARDANMDCRLKSRVGKGYRLSILIEGINLNE